MFGHIIRLVLNTPLVLHLNNQWCVIEKPFRHLTWRFLQKSTEISTVNYFQKKLHLI